MIPIIATAVCGGAGLAATAQHFPRRTAAVEWAGGALVIAGLMLLGASLSGLFI